MHHFNACRPKLVLAAGYAPALATLSTSCLRRLDYASERTGASSRCCPGTISLQNKSTGCCKEAVNGLPAVARRSEGWSQSPVLPWAQRAYETCLSAGSTAVLAYGHGHEIGAPTRSCTELASIPKKCIAQNALGAVKLASLTGFAPVISCMRGRHVVWTTPQGRK